MSDLYFEALGAGDPIVLIHGFSLNQRMWRPQVRALSSRYKTITYDMRGFGRSPLPVGKYSHRADLAELLHDLDISSAHTVGLSMGGRVAIDFALEYPDMVRSLVLIDSAVGGARGHAARNPDVEALGLERAKQFWMNGDLFASSRKRPEALAVLKEIIDDYSGWHWSRRSTETTMDPSALERLSDIAVPTLIAVGEEDMDYFQKTYRVLCAGIPHATKVLIPGAGHMSNLDNPRYVNEMLESFLSRPESSK